LRQIHNQDSKPKPQLNAQILYGESSELIPQPSQMPKVAKSAKRIVIIVTLLCVPLAILMFSFYNSAERNRIRFLEAKTYRDMIPATMRSTPFWKSVPFQIRIYTFAGDYESVAQGLKTELETKGWHYSSSAGGICSFQKDTRRIVVWPGRSVFTMSAGNPSRLLNNTPNWVSVDYSIDSRDTAMRPILDAFVGGR
jgi:hypothetical protein